jgi:hypothetical protein
MPRKRSLNPSDFDGRLMDGLIAMIQREIIKKDAALAALPSIRAER